MKIVQINDVSSHKQGTLFGLKKADIDRALGFSVNREFDEKVEYYWGFKALGSECAVWDWKGSARMDEWSFYGPADTMRDIFGAEHVRVGAFA